MEAILAIAGAITLGASSGLRVTLPMFLVSLAAAGVIPLGIGQQDLPAGLQWIGAPLAPWILGGAYAMERIVYLIPAVDNVADFIIGVPGAPVAGTMLAMIAMGGATESAAVASAVPVPAADAGGTSLWMAAALLGGLPALAVQGITIAGRLLSSVFSMGCFNGAFSLLEDAAALLLVVLAVVATVVAILVLAALVTAAIVMIVKARNRRKAA